MTKSEGAITQRERFVLCTTKVLLAGYITLCCLFILSVIIMIIINGDRTGGVFVGMLAAACIMCFWIVPVFIILVLSTVYTGIKNMLTTVDQKAQQRMTILIRGTFMLILLNVIEALIFTATPTFCALSDLVLTFIILARMIIIYKRTLTADQKKNSDKTSKQKPKHKNRGTIIS